jgi:two-component system KDP operon response regulator KdpE
MFAAQMRNHPARNLRTLRQPPPASFQQPEAEAEEIVSSKELNFDFARRVITVRGKPVHLTPKEFELLRHLVLSHDRPIAHHQLLQAVWGPTHGRETELLRVVINQLRKKIEREPARPKYIQTEFCIGYRFALPAGARVRTAP